MSELKRYFNYIGGKWKEPATKKYYQDINPANEDDIIGEFPLSDTSDVKDAVEAANNAFPMWSRLKGAERAKYLQNLITLMGSNKQRIGEAICREQGKILKDALGEPTRSITEIGFFAGEAVRMEGITMPSNRKGVTSVAMRVPLGVVAAIAPWNFPFLTPIRKIIPALAGGNTIVSKPASDTPLSSVILFELFDEAGFPPGVVNLFMGKGGDIGDALSSNPLVRGITFTGSTIVGQRISEQSAKNFTKLQLEMGGKNPAIVAEYKNLDQAGKELSSNAYALAGQRCTAISRVIVLENEADELTAAISKYMQKNKLGDGFDPQVTIGPITTRKAGEKILEYIHQAVDQGATLHTGGHALSGGIYDKGMFIEPTLLTNVTPEMTIAKEEVFGPVLVILKVKSMEEAIQVANNTEYGLSAAIFSDNLRYIHQFLENVQAGNLHVNHGTVTDDYMPFGGVKRSGLGSFSKGRTNLDFFTNYKVQYIQWE
jgi:acyl-CoA reductase-like NAD-dependent aldehyde dehydrogenase